MMDERGGGVWFGLFSLFLLVALVIHIYPIFSLRGFDVRAWREHFVV